MGHGYVYRGLWQGEGFSIKDLLYGELREDLVMLVEVALSAIIVGLLAILTFAVYVFYL